MAIAHQDRARVAGRSNAFQSGDRSGVRDACDLPHLLDRVAARGCVRQRVFRRFFGRRFGQFPRRHYLPRPVRPLNTTLPIRRRTVNAASLRRAHVRTAVLLACVAWVTSVLAASPPGRYSQARKTVKDNLTGLVWQQSVDSGMYNWDDAKTYCQQLQLDGGGWRLPTCNELLTLVDPTQSSPALIDSTAFRNTPATYFW